MYLNKLDTGHFQFQKIIDDSVYNYAYFPLVFESESHLNAVLEALNNQHIFPRRYFYPSLNTIDYLNGKPMKVSESIAKRILCLPLYYDLTENDVDRIIKIIKSV